MLGNNSKTKAHNGFYVCEFQNVGKAMRYTSSLSYKQINGRRKRTYLFKLFVL